MALTDLRSATRRQRAKTYTLGDYDGLSLLGMSPELSSREARAMRDEARTLIAKGVNPRISRKQKQHPLGGGCEDSAKGAAHRQGCAPR